MILPDSHSTDTRTSLIAWLYSAICSVKFMFLCGVCRCNPKGYAESPIYRVDHHWKNATLRRSWRTPVSSSMVLSWRLPSNGPCKLAIRPFGITILWNFIECTRLCPLYITLWFCCGFAMPHTVPSMKPKQLFNGAPCWWTASAYNTMQYKLINTPQWGFLVLITLNYNKIMLRITINYDENYNKITIKLKWVSKYYRKAKNSYNSLVLNFLLKVEMDSHHLIVLSKLFHKECSIKKGPLSFRTLKWDV